uniref:C-type lectin domain-containing protein n=1 Tax=Monopterus albus TaxID=43700 RepID=A0A3Q3ILR6_MONAL
MPFFKNRPLFTVGNTFAISTSTKVTMAEAQRYCREHYTDLATIDNMEDMNILKNMRAWIGLYDDINSWRWSLADGGFFSEGEDKFRNWAPDQPDNYQNKEKCAAIDNTGQWLDYNCENTLPAVCLDHTYAKSSVNIYVIITVTSVLTNSVKLIM